MTTKTYRFKLDDVLLEKIKQFADLHRDDEPDTFSDSFDQWFKENNELIKREERRLILLGYDKSIQTKIFKSARYYFKNKCVQEKEPTQRRNYVGSTKEFREAIDSHISNIANKLGLKPASAFSNFILHADYQMILTKAKEDFRGYGFSTDMIDNKIKKTYKNRYFTHQKHNL